MGACGELQPSSSASAPPPVLRSRRGHGAGDVSEGPSESSAHVEDTEDDDFQSTIPHLERFYEQLAAKARLPARHGASGANYLLSLARSYRRLSKDKRRRGRLRALQGPGGLPRGGPGGPGVVAGLEQPGWSSNTDDSGYEAGYETDADESELSEWESGSARQGHKRKLDALVQLTFKLGISEGGSAFDGCSSSPPMKTPRALGTAPCASAGGLGGQQVGTRIALPPRAWLAAPPPSPGGSAPPSPNGGDGGAPSSSAMAPSTLGVTTCTSPSTSLAAASRGATCSSTEGRGEGEVAMMDIG